MNAFPAIAAALSVIIASFKAMKSDGKITLQEAVKFVLSAVSQIVQLTQTLAVSGPEKKAAALKAIEQFIDEVITPLDLPGIPNMIEPIFDRGLKSLLMLAADAGIDAAVALFNRIGWPADAVPELPEG